MAAIRTKHITTYRTLRRAVTHLQSAAEHHAARLGSADLAMILTRDHDDYEDPGLRENPSGSLRHLTHERFATRGHAELLALLRDGWWALAMQGHAPSNEGRSSGSSGTDGSSCCLPAPKHQQFVLRLSRALLREDEEWNEELATVLAEVCWLGDSRNGHPLTLSRFIDMMWSVAVRIVAPPAD